MYPLPHPPLLPKTPPAKGFLKGAGDCVFAYASRHGPAGSAEPSKEKYSEPTHQQEEARETLRQQSMGQFHGETGCAKRDHA